MNPKIAVGVITAAFAIALGVVAVSGQSVVQSLSGFDSQRQPAEILPIEIELDGITIEEADMRHAELQIEFTIVNPNENSVLLPFVSYHLYESGVRIHAGEIGERLESMVVGSNYVTLLSGQPVSVRDKITLVNTGNTEELWDAILADTAQWSVTGEAVYALSSVTAGGQNIIQFEFEP